MPKSSSSPPEKSVRGSASRSRRGSKYEFPDEGVSAYAGEATPGVWRAWSPQIPAYYGEGDSEQAAIVDLRKRLDLASTARRLAMEAAANPDAIQPEEEVQLDEYGLTGKVTHASSTETLAMKLRASLRGESIPMFIRRAGTASAFAKLTGRSPEEYAELVRNLGEPKAMEITALNILEWLSVGSEAGSPGYFQALCIIAGDAARNLESARIKQPALARSNSESMLGWPLFWSPYLGRGWRGKDGKAYINEVIESLNLGAKREWANSRAKETGTDIQTGPVILGGCVKCMHGAVTRARAATNSQHHHTLVDHVPWAVEAASLQPLSADGNAGVSEAWFQVAWKALLWAFDGAPEKHAELASEIDRLRKRQQRTEQGALELLLRSAWKKRYGQAAKP